MMTPEPILDIVRGLSTVASFAIVLNQARTLWEECFVSKCAHCRGAGTVICSRCSGTKTLRRRPAQLRIKDLDLLDAPGDTYPCIYCGPASKYDYTMDEPDDELEAYTVLDNFKAAMANKLRPHRPQVLAGTVPCPECQGHPLIRRHTANLEKAFNLEEPWQFSISQRLGNRYIGRENRPASRRRNYLEYPSRPPMLGEEAPYEEEKKEKREADGALTLSAKDQLTLSDYELPYIDEDDTEEEDQ